MTANCTLNFDSSSAMAAVNQDFRDISKLCAKNSLLINPEKTKLVVVGSAQLIKRLPHISLSLLGKTISPPTQAAVGIKFCCQSCIRFKEV